MREYFRDLLHLVVVGLPLALLMGFVMHWLFGIGRL
jgi:hypothetical protein